ncbi:hypothetical protein BGX28_007997 [Mortierella sp. GBA30]|nr:hypothetical protein BGX28_007997 [Mortierella sp. GBA30]
MFSRIAARLIHTIMFIIAAAVGLIHLAYALYLRREDVTTTQNKKRNGDHYNYSWLTYYLLTISAMGALQTLLWIFQSRIYENGRPTVQECLLNAIFAVVFLFAAAWQFYQSFANQDPNEFVCSTPSYDEMIHCRLWQAQLVGCAVCGIMFFLSTILWIILFRQRPLVIKDLPDDLITNSPTTQTSVTEREDAAQRERDEVAAIAAEAERRRVQQRQQQQQMQQLQMQRPAPITRPTHPYQQQQQQNPYQNNHMVAPGQLQHQGSSGYINPGPAQQHQQPYFDQQQYQQPRIQPQTQPSYSSGNVNNDVYYNGSYGLQNQRPSYELTAPTTSAGYHQHQHPGAIGATAPPLAAPGYTEEPGTYEAPVTSNAGQYTNGAYTDYAYGQFNPAETFEDPTSKEAQAHLAYANQLREQQLYHQNMAEVLQKQQQQKMQKQQQQQQQQPLDRDNDPNLPSSGSTASFYPKPPQHSATMPALGPPSSSASVAATAGTSSRGGASTGAAGGEHAYMAATSQNNVGTGMITPGSTSSTGRPAPSPKYKNSPQLYHSDEVTSHYSDDRYKAELLGEVRKVRQEGQRSNPEGLGEEYEDYKVQVPSPRNESSRPNSATYVPPPPSKARTMWS